MQNIHYYARFHACNSSITACSISLLNLNILPSIYAIVPVHVSRLIPPFAIILLMAEWSLVAARDRKQCEEVPAERRECKIALVGAFREPATGLDKPDTRPLEQNSRRSLVSKPSSPSCARASSPFVTSFDLAVALSAARHLCEHHGPSVQTGLSPGPDALKPSEAKEPVYTIGVWTRKTARQQGKGTTRRGLFRLGRKLIKRVPWKRKEDDTWGRYLVGL